MTTTRNKVGLTQTELGCRTGSSQEAISFYKNGLQAIPDVMLEQIERALLDAAEFES